LARSKSSTKSAFLGSALAYFGRPAVGTEPVAFFLRIVPLRSQVVRTPMAIRTAKPATSRIQVFFLIMSMLGVLPRRMDFFSVLVCLGRSPRRDAQYYCSAGRGESNKTGDLPD
jgi:hypothetical protein